MPPDLCTSSFYRRELNSVCWLGEALDEVEPGAVLGRRRRVEFLDFMNSVTAAIALRSLQSLDRRLFVHAQHNGWTCGFCHTGTRPRRRGNRGISEVSSYCCGFNPSASNCRLHSAGASRSLSILMPRGRRPSTAARTSLGARKASEIVMFTCLTLHFSRNAICSASVTEPEIISSSQRRPRAMALTRRRRRSGRSGRISFRAEP